MAIRYQDPHTGRFITREEWLAQEADERGDDFDSWDDFEDFDVWDEDEYGDAKK